MVVENWDAGDLGMEFFIFGGDDEMSLLSALYKYVGDRGVAANDHGFGQKEAA